MNNIPTLPKLIWNYIATFCPTKTLQDLRLCNSKICDAVDPVLGKHFPVFNLLKEERLLEKKAKKIMGTSFVLSPWFPLKITANCISFFSKKKGKELQKLENEQKEINISKEKLLDFPKGSRSYQKVLRLFGGPEGYLKLPFLSDNIDLHDIKMQAVSAPIMRGKIKDIGHFFVVCTEDKRPEKYRRFQIYVFLKDILKNRLSEGVSGCMGLNSLLGRLINNEASIYNEDYLNIAIDIAANRKFQSTGYTLFENLILNGETEFERLLSLEECPSYNL